MHVGEGRRDHVGSGNVGQVSSLAHSANQEDGGHALECTKGHNVLSPVHANSREGDREGRVLIDLLVRLHKAEGDGKEAVNGSGDGHGPDEANGDVPGRVFGLLGHGGDGVEANIGEEEDGRGFEDSAGAVGGEGGVIGGVGLGEASDDDEEEDDDVDDGGDEVEAGGALGAHDGDDGDDGDDPHGDGVEVAVVRAEAVDNDAEVFGVVVEEGREVGGPGAGHRSSAYDILEEDVSGCDEGDEVTQLHP